jgi:membrane fusion protein (multidrug efflux system)
MDARLARQEHAEATWNLAKTEVRAPIGGRVSQRSAQPGQHLRPADELFQITDFDPLIAYVYLPEKDVLALATGRQVDLALDAAPAVAFHGRVRQISPVVDPATGTVKVTIEATSPPAQVRPGSFVTVKIVRQRRPDAVVLPKEAVIRELQQAHVFVARRDGDKLTASRRAVTLGLEEDSRVEVLSGLAAGVELIVAGQGALKDGTAIRVLDDAAREG